MRRLAEKGKPRGRGDVAPRSAILFRFARRRLRPSQAPQGGDDGHHCRFAGRAPNGEVGQLAALAEGGAVFWLDVSGGETEAQALPLGKLGFEATDVAWAMRFGQGGRMNVREAGCGLRPGCGAERPPG